MQNSAALRTRNTEILRQHVGNAGILEKMLLWVNYKSCSLYNRSDFKLFFYLLFIKISSGRVDRASAAEVVGPGSILGQVKPKTIKIGIHSFRA